VAVYKPRERLVYFRISEDEFRQFSSVCEQGGARSVSDLARNAVQRLIADAQRQREGDELEEKMRVLENLIAAVTEQLHLLATSQGRESGGATVNHFHGGSEPAPAGQTGREE
jgi:vacuolar-type H+-ATPase subunit E/Vma4